MGDSILVVNTGSSSVKFGVYRPGSGDEELLFDGEADGIGRGRGSIQLKDGAGKMLRSDDSTFQSDGEALDRVAQWLSDAGMKHPDAVGHRVVHGGPRLVTHQRVTPEVLNELRSCEHLAPLHIPAALESIGKITSLFPNSPQYACFDTAFHRDMPEAAARFALPGNLWDAGVRRYGFHGLSYESIVHELGRDLPSRAVIAHLGSGCSLAAVRDGRSVDTTMAFTPTAGVVMGTRCGDVDPGVMLYLMRSGKNADEIERLVNHDSGLAGLSGGTSDMRDLEAAATSGDARATLAIEIFCRTIAKTVGAYAAVLGGIDMLIFSGGIGEHSANVRDRVCTSLGFLGGLNVRVVASQEDRQIARHCRRLMATGRGDCEDLRHARD